jgi:hypothetical protein
LVASRRGGRFLSLRAPPFGYADDRGAGAHAGNIGIDHRGVEFGAYAENAGIDEHEFSAHAGIHLEFASVAGTARMAQFFTEMGRFIAIDARNREFGRFETLRNANTGLAVVNGEFGSRG